MKHFYDQALKHATMIFAAAIAFAIVCAVSSIIDYIDQIRQYFP